ncbi:AmmeMemoRadiSam system protein B [Candidatus Woesearchaeota archaeon]|nr:MAG: AmmeMemoRadiSam system protein B [Candidatus Woesearchaeota archaeon]
MRQAIHAGSFYEKNANALTKQIQDCFSHDKGPGDLPVNKRLNKIKAVIAPHAGYQYSGPCAAWAYKEIAESHFPELYIIIGPNHANNGTFLSMDLWQTPFGEIRIDHVFAELLMKKNGIKVNEDAHQKEHSIEVQLPFLQFATQDRMHELKILPIIIDDSCDLKKLALDIKETILETQRDVIFIVSSDFTHYGRMYHHVPFSIDVKKNIYAFDEQAIEFIKTKNPEGLLQFHDEKISSICGIYAIALLLHTVKIQKVSMEQYYTSADLTESDYKNSVSYASIIIS